MILIMIDGLLVVVLMRSFRSNVFLMAQMLRGLHIFNSASAASALAPRLHNVKLQQTLHSL